jgi:ACS family hexuronate transporter-like MFS transporter
VRWVVCAFLFFATTINYIDRQVLSILKPMMQDQYGWTEADYGWIASAFTFGYALMMPVAGWLIDRLGTRMGYVLAFIFWTLSSISHAFARSVVQFMIVRVSLGIGEAANFPAAVRTVADWFPQKERSLATGIFNSGSNVGLVIAAGAPFIAIRWGWQSAFLMTGALGVLWLVPWMLWYRRPEDHPRLSTAEHDYIRSDQRATDVGKVPYMTLLKHRGAWAFMVGKFVTDPVWWFFLFWIPSFLNSNYDVDLTSLGPPLLVIFLAADVGSIGGGWLFKGLSARGWTPNRARKGAMFICAVTALPVMGILVVESLWPAVFLISFAAAAHQGFSANLFTLVSDTSPRESVASVVGMGGLAGAVSGIAISPAVGYWLDFSGGTYAPLFFIAGIAYLIAFGLIHALVPQLDELHPDSVEPA